MLNRKFGMKMKSCRQLKNEECYPMQDSPYIMYVVIGHFVFTLLIGEIDRKYGKCQEQNRLDIHI